jgi:hypothetical protein
MFDDEAWVDLPHDQVTARTLLDLATENGYEESVIRASEDGYFVPSPMVDLLYPQSQPVPEEG